MKPGKGFARKEPAGVMLARGPGPKVAKPATPRPKRCKACKTIFTPSRRLQAVCSPACAHRLVQIQNAKALAQAALESRKATRARLEEMKPLSFWVKKAQAVFNGYVRLRDITAGHGCIDCRMPFEPNKPGGSVDAGHYLSRGSAPHLKFDERNVFAQRKNCNRPGGATRDDFRAGVIDRIGLAAVEALESDQTVKQYRREDLKEIVQTYAAKTRELRKGAR